VSTAMQGGVGAPTKMRTTVCNDAMAGIILSWSSSYYSFTWSFL